MRVDLPTSRAARNRANSEHHEPCVGLSTAGNSNAVLAISNTQLPRSQCRAGPPRRMIVALQTARPAMQGQHVKLLNLCSRTGNAIARWAANRCPIRISRVDRSSGSDGQSVCPVADCSCAGVRKCRRRRANLGIMDVAGLRCCRDEYLVHQLLVSETDAGNSFAGIRASAKYSTADCEATSGYSAKVVSGVVQTQHPFPLVKQESLIKL